MAWYNIKNTVTSIGNAIKNAVTTVWNNITSAVKNAMSNVFNAVKTGFSNVKEHITGLASQAFNWGKDLIKRYKDSSLYSVNDTSFMAAGK